MTKQVHIVMASKGGVGKSFIASTLAQYFNEKGHKLACLDTDPSTQTFASIEALCVKPIDLMSAGDIDPRKFDALIEHIIEAPPNTIIVIDTGSSNYIPLLNYAAENRIFAFLDEQNIDSLIHSVVAGGHHLGDTSAAAADLIEAFPNQRFIIWLNEYFGLVERKGKAFESTAVYLENKSRIEALLRLPQWRAQTYGVDIRAMQEELLTFGEAIEASSTSLMAKQRLKTARDELFHLLDEALPAFSPTATLLAIDGGAS